MSTSHTLTARLAKAFEVDVSTIPLMTLRQADAVDSYAEPPAYDQTLDAVSDLYVERYGHGVPHLDAASWRHYLPILGDYALRHLNSGHIAVGTLIDSLRPPDRDPPRLASLTSAQEELVRELLEQLAFSPDSSWQSEACQALEEWWIDKPLYRPTTGKP
jgi:hypothetical protein